jgi:N,N'-diacetyllegionaminate synthase
MSEAPSRVQLIAEVGQAHDGSLGMAHAYVDAVAATGVATIKFQVHIAEAESSAFEPFRVSFSRADATRYDYWRRMEFTLDQWRELHRHCQDKGLEFLASPFSVAAVELLEAVGVARYKVGSGETSNFLMLERIARTGKPVILSSGLSTFADLDATVAFLRALNVPLSILQCTSSYPAPAAQWGLNVIPELKARYGLPTGLSDHSGTIFPSLAAVALGAELLEFHVVFDRRSFGPDATSSLELDEVAVLARGVALLAESHACPVDKNVPAPAELRRMFGKSLAVSQDLPAGHVLRPEDLESKKPGDRGISAARHREVIGRRLARPLRRWDFLTEDDLEAAGR